MAVSSDFFQGFCGVAAEVHLTGAEVLGRAERCMTAALKLEAR